jgi:hypothetical protein
VRANRERILAAVELGLSNSKLEGLNRKIRLINHRGYGHHSAAALIAIIYLCCGDITVDLPFGVSWVTAPKRALLPVEWVISRAARGDRGGSRRVRAGPERSALRVT